MARTGFVQDLINEWLTDEKPQNIAYCKVTDLYAMFQDWCDIKQKKIPTYQSFNNTMKVVQKIERSNLKKENSVEKKPKLDPAITLEQKEKNIVVNVDLLAGEFTNGFILSGPTGIGKTTQVLQRLKFQNLEYHYFNGAIGNALEFYKYLYHHREDEILVIDDTAGLIGSNAACGDIVSAALDDNHCKQNVVSYLHKDLKYPEEIAAMPDGSKRKEKAIPNKFLVTSGMIFLTNTPMSQISKAIGSRCFPLDYWLTKDEILLKIENHLKDIHPHYEMKQKREVLKFFQDHKNEMKRFDIRSFKKACMYRYAEEQLNGKANWKVMTMVAVNSAS